MVPMAPSWNFTIESAASSTSTLPFPFPSGRGRSLMKVFRKPATSAISPTSMRARSTEWEERSPSAPEPALDFSSRHTRGKSGFTIQSWR